MSALKLDVAPPGREKQVKELKKAPGVDNPYAVSWASYNRGKDGSEGVFTQGGLALNAGEHGDVIRKQGGAFALYSRKTGKVIATHKTREGAEAQERAIQANKHHDAEARGEHGRWISGGGAVVKAHAPSMVLHGGAPSLKGAGKVALGAARGGVKIGEASMKVGKTVATAPIHTAKAAMHVGKVAATAPLKVAKAVATAPIKAVKSEPAKKIGGGIKKGLASFGKALEHVPLARSSWWGGSRDRRDEVVRVPAGQPGGGQFAPKGGGGGSGSVAVHTAGAAPAETHPAKPTAPTVDPARTAKLAKDIEHHVGTFGPKTQTELQEATGAQKHEVQAATHHLVKQGSHYVEGRTGRLKERVRPPNAAEGGAPPSRWKKHVAAGLRGALEGAGAGAAIGAAAGEVVGALPGAAVGALIGAGSGVLASHLEEPAIARTAAPITKQAIAETARRQQEQGNAKGKPNPASPKQPGAKAPINKPVKMGPPSKTIGAPAPVVKVPPHMNSADR